jgi:hypothetical protein
MDVGKIPVDKAAFFVAGLVPGAVAVYIYYLANPAALHGFLAAGLFGYRTKLWLATGFCFVAGNTITLFAYVLAGSFWGAFGPVLSRKFPRKALPSAPWRDPTWRRLAKKYLRDNAPDDTMPMTEEDLNNRTQALAQLPPAEGWLKERELRELQVKLVSDDGAWSTWYLQFNDQLRLRQGGDFSSTLAQGIRANLQATAVYVAVSMIFVPALRNWMCITFVLGWLWIIFAQTYTAYVGSANPWTTWFGQLELLAERILGQAKASEQAAENDGG